MIARRMNPGLIVAVLVAVFAVLVLSTAYTYPGISGTFPQLVGWVFLGLALLEVLVQVKALIRTAPRGRKNENADAGGDQPLSVVKEIKGIAWLGGLLVALYLVGFLITTPLYVFAFLRFSGQRSLGLSAGIAAGATAFVYVVFVRLLEYKLFPGVFL